MMDVTIKCPYCTMLIEAKICMTFPIKPSAKNTTGYGAKRKKRKGR